MGLVNAPQPRQVLRFPHCNWSVPVVKDRPSRVVAGRCLPPYKALVRTAGLHEASVSLLEEYPLDIYLLVAILEQSVLRWRLPAMPHATSRDPHEALTLAP